MAFVYGAGSTSISYSNEIRYNGATLTFWVYILDAISEQMLFCK